MIKKLLLLISLTFFFFTSESLAFSNNVKIANVEFPKEKIIEGKILKLNGVSILKKFGIVEVYAVGLYLENLTNNPNEIITSEQIKYLHTQYLTNKATKNKIRNGFIEYINKCNTDELVKTYQNEINLFASWIDSDMDLGYSSETIYTPEKGLTLIYKGEIKGTIPGKEFANMYYNYNLGEKANKTIKNGLLGLTNN